MANSALHEQVEALRGHFSNELLAADGALANSQAELASTKSLLADAQGQLRHNEHELAHLRLAASQNHTRADRRRPAHGVPIAVSLLLQEVRELERWIDEAALARRRQEDAERLQDFFAAQLQGQEVDAERWTEERMCVVAHARKETAQLQVALRHSREREEQAQARLAAAEEDAQLRGLGEVRAAAAAGAMRATRNAEERHRASEQGMGQRRAGQEAEQDEVRAARGAVVAAPVGGPALPVGGAGPKA